MSTEKSSNEVETSALNKGAVSNRLWSQDEKKEVVFISVRAWDWYFPGWKWVAARLNSEFQNNRTPEACRKMAARLGLNGC